MKLNISITAEVDPQEVKQLLKLAKKFGATELLQTALQSAATSTPAPADEPELPIGTFVGGEEVPIEEPTPVPTTKRGRKPKAVLGFR